MKLTEQYLHKVLTNVLKESLRYDEEPTQFEEYMNGYNDFDPNSVDINELLSFVQYSGDFLYCYNWQMHTANSDNIINEIADDIQRYGAIISHDIDTSLEWEWDKFFGNDDIYLVVFKIQPSNSDAYYVLYVRDKYDSEYNTKDYEEDAY